MAVGSAAAASALILVLLPPPAAAATDCCVDAEHPTTGDWRPVEWSGRQVMPKEWIAQSARHQADAKGPLGEGFGGWVSTAIPGM
jgi:hypothetical protein